VHFGTGRVLTEVEGTTVSALEHISIKGFKSIRGLEKLTLRPINVIIGANGAGKSSFIEVFELFHALREGRLAKYVPLNGGADKLLHFGSKHTGEMHLAVWFRGESTEGYEITLMAAEPDTLIPVREQTWRGGEPPSYVGAAGEALEPEGKEAGISRSHQDFLAAQLIRDHLGSWRIYHFHDTGRSSPLKRTADVNDNRFLRGDGSNLAAYLYLLQTVWPDSYERIRQAIKRMAPFFDDFVLHPLQLNDSKIQLQWRHTDSDAYFDVSSLSDGTLRFMALATLFLQPAKLSPTVFLVDEPELGLHPSAITILASMVRSAAAEGKQVIISTQSSFLLDHFDPGDVIVAERDQGGSVFHRLEPDAYEEWLEDYSLGQLWEKNELGGRPGPEIRKS
jgi:predicted ATPase